MAYERVQKSTWQPQIQKKQSRIVPPPIDIQTEAKSLPSPKLVVSGLPSQEEREAIKRSIFGHGTEVGQIQTKTESPQCEAIPEEDELQMKSDAGTIQREVVPDEKLQMKPLAQHVRSGLVQLQSDEAEAVARQVLAKEAVQVSKSAIPGLYRTPLYRGMIEDGNRPKIGPTARTLGVRESEITLREENGVKVITSDGKGMSTAPDTPRNLPEHRRDTTWGGKGKDPVWEIDDGNMTGDLKAIKDSNTHVTVAPSKDMPLKDYEAALAKTQSKWVKKVGP